MGVLLGNSAITGGYIGTSAVTAMYLGSTPIWTAVQHYVLSVSGISHSISAAGQYSEVKITTVAGVQQASIYFGYDSGSGIESISITADNPEMVSSWDSTNELWVVSGIPENTTFNVTYRKQMGTSTPWMNSDEINLSADTTIVASYINQQKRRLSIFGLWPASAIGEYVNYTFSGYTYESYMDANGVEHHSKPTVPGGASTWTQASGTGMINTVWEDDVVYSATTVFSSSTEYGSGVTTFMWTSADTFSLEVSAATPVIVSSDRTLTIDNVLLPGSSDESGDLTVGSVFGATLEYDLNISDGKISDTPFTLASGYSYTATGSTLQITGPWDNTTYQVTCSWNNFTMSPCGYDPGVTAITWSASDTALTVTCPYPSPTLCPEPDPGEGCNGDPECECMQMGWIWDGSNCIDPTLPPDP